MEAKGPLADGQVFPAKLESGPSAALPWTCFSYDRGALGQETGPNAASPSVDVTY